jgi:hypothetical protein
MTQRKRRPKAKAGRKPRKTKSAQNSVQAASRERQLKAIEPYRFKPGQSGNPGGRPKRDYAAEIAQAVFEQNPDLIYKAMLKSLKRGSAGSFAVLAERGYGKTPQHVELSGQSGGPIQVEFVNVATLQES